MLQHGLQSISHSPPPSGLRHLTSLLHRLLLRFQTQVSALRPPPPISPSSLSPFAPSPPPPQVSNSGFSPSSPPPPQVSNSGLSPPTSDLWSLDNRHFFLLQVSNSGFSPSSPSVLCSLVTRHPPLLHSSLKLKFHPFRSLRPPTSARYS